MQHITSRVPPPSAYLQILLTDAVRVLRDRAKRLPGVDRAELFSRPSGLELVCIEGTRVGEVVLAGRDVAEILQKAEVL